MMGPLLVDTSVWIDFFKGNNTEAVQTLSSYLENDGPIYLCPIIVQEVLQGIRSDKQYHQVKDYLLALPVFDDDALQVGIGAADLYRTLRKKGITIRKSNDCLIAQYARINGVGVLHRDRDFDLIQKGLS